MFLVGCYTLMPPESPVMRDLVLHWRVPNAEWLLPFNVTGLERAALMCLQILTLLLASALVRLTGSGDDLVQGLRVLRVPRCSSTRSITRWRCSAAPLEEPVTPTPEPVTRPPPSKSPNNAPPVTRPEPQPVK